MSTEEKITPFYRTNCWRENPANGFEQDKLRFRFPPRTIYLHIGHAKSICLQFGLIAYNAPVNLRFDDTNPAKESRNM
jgi:glutaminyl-tRNA synthetase